MIIEYKMSGLYVLQDEVLWGNILDFDPSRVGDENKLGTLDKIKTSIFMIFQSEIVPLN